MEKIKLKPKRDKQILPKEPNDKRGDENVVNITMKDRGDTKRDIA
jgi:hypothetical protein